MHGINNKLWRYVVTQKELAEIKNNPMLLNQAKPLHIALEDKDYYSFYQSKEWKEIRKVVLPLDRNECQICKSKGYYTKATEVHHVNRLSVKPLLAEQIYYIDADNNIQRQLVSLCKTCHKHLHEQEDRGELPIEYW